MGVHYGPRPTGNLPPIVTPPTAELASGNIKPINATQWIRPTDWLPMPQVVETDQVFYGLVAVFDLPVNFLTFRATGNYTIDWGDGSPPENYSSNVVAYHNYNYADLSSATVTATGYRQAMVTVTPQSGQTISAINLNYKHNQPGLTNNSTTGWLDIKFAMNNAGTFYQYNSIWRHHMLERIHWVGTTSSQTSGNQLFRLLRGLRSVPNLPFASLTDCFAMFMDCMALGDDGFPTLPSTATCNNFHYMFYNCYNLQVAPTLQTNVATLYSYMFRFCYRLKYVPPLTWDNITNSEYMFQDCFCLELLSDASWNTSNNTRMEYMFSGCYALRFIPAMDTSNVTRLDGTFLACRSLTEMPEIDTSACINLYRFMESCTKVKYTRFVGSNSTVTRMDRMFLACYRLEYLPSLDTSNVTNMDNMFNGCINIKRFTQNAFDFSSCTRAAAMFAGMNQLRVAPSLINSSLLTDIDNLFTSCYYLSEIGYIDTQSVSDFYRMFINCFSLTGLDWEIDCRSATRVQGMFYSCISLIKAPALRNLNLVNQCTDYRDLFYNCNSLQEFTNIEFDTSNGTSFYFMFYNCLSLTEIPFHLDTSSGVDFTGMFRNCRVLEKFNQIDDKFDTTYGRAYQQMFWDCHNLKTVPDIEIFNVLVDENGNDVSMNTNLDYMFTSCYNLEFIPPNLFNKTYVNIDGVPTSWDMFVFALNCFSLNTVPNMSFNQVFRFYQAFQSCRNIEYFPAIDTSNANDVRYMFAYCFAMKELPANLNLANVTTAYAFAINCWSVRHIPDLNGPGAACNDFRYMFYNSENIITCDATFDTSNATNVARMWGYSRGIKKLPGTYNFQNCTTESTSATAGVNQFIIDCSSLQEVTIINVSRNMYFQNCSFNRDEIVKMFNNLANITAPVLYPGETIARVTARTLYIGGNYGLQTLSQTDRDIALNKGWILNG